MPGDGEGATGRCLPTMGEGWGTGALYVFLPGWFLGEGLCSDARVYVWEEEL